MIPIFDYATQSAEVWRRLHHAPTEDVATGQAVPAILAAVRERGDAALREYTERFDGVALEPEQFRLSEEQLAKAWNGLDPALQEALRLAETRIRAFHERQRRDSWTLDDPQGFRLSQRWLPLASAGLYVPGGRAAYPSSVLMNAIPAQVAGVKRLVAVTPPGKPNQPMNAAVLGALHLLGIREVYRVGGAQAVAALAYGTESIPRVDIVVGPGNKYVSEAKRLLYGTIRIDMVAGPSEVLILADDSVPIEWIAADVLAQAEHEPEAQAAVVLWGGADGKALRAEIVRQYEIAPRREILKESLGNLACIVLAKDALEAISIANQKAPEHLEILARDARALSEQVVNAGSIFLGSHGVTAIGDYIAGPNHVLPTGGAARAFSPLSVQDFLKITQVIEPTDAGMEVVGPHAATLADAEGFHAHAFSIRCRLPRR